MPSASENRLDLRMASDDKELLETAATLTGQTLSSFIKFVALREARATIEEAAKTQLSRRDQQRFVEVVLGDTKPSERLLTAAQRYKSRIKTK